MKLNSAEISGEKKPTLHYLEIHLTDHCNLRCKGCGHFSSISEEWYADPEEHNSDMQQLTKLLASIRTIRLMGGEPLLHPKVVLFMESTRAAFPGANISIVTNGILLDKMTSLFWNSCNANAISIAVTVYPVFKKQEARLKSLAASMGTDLNAMQMDSFYAFYNRKGNTDIGSAFKKCRSWMFCPNLKRGKIYPCPIAAHIQIFNRRYAVNVPSSAFIDIYSYGIDGWKIKAMLAKGLDTCAFCTFGWECIPSFKWEQSSSHAEITEWDYEYACKKIGITP